MGFPTLRAAFQQFAVAHPEHPLAPETTTANVSLAPGLIGLSFSSCLGDIANHRVAMDDVGTIVAAFSGRDNYPHNTVYMSKKDLTLSLQGYGKYNKKFKPAGDAALAARQLQNSGKIWRSTAFPTPHGGGYARYHGSFGPNIWIDPRTGELMNFRSSRGKAERETIDLNKLRPDELQLIAGLHQFYPDNPLFKKAFEMV